MYPLYDLPRMLSLDFTSDFWFIIITIVYLLISCFTTCVLFHQSSTLILSYLSSSCLISLAIYLSASVCLSSRHDFQCMFMIQIYRYMCAYLRMLLGISSTTCWGVLALLDPHVQVLELGACEFS